MTAHPLLTHVVIDYQSRWSLHHMVRPVRTWIGGTIGDPGQFENWDLTLEAADDQIVRLINHIAPVMLATTHFRGYTIWNRPTEADVPMPVYAAAVSVAGSSMVDGFDRATEAVYIVRTTDFNLSRFVLLDLPVDNAFGKYSTLDPDSASLMTEFQAASNAWAGRDVKQPFDFTQVSVGINDRLARKYPPVV